MTIKHQAQIECDACHKTLKARADESAVIRAANVAGWQLYSGDYGYELHFCRDCDNNLPVHLIDLAETIGVPVCDRCNLPTTENRDVCLRCAQEEKETQ